MLACAARYRLMDTMVLIAGRLLIVIFLVLASGFFVASEYALITIRKTRLNQLIAEGNRAATAVRRTVEEMSTLLAATQLGVTIISLALGALAEPTVARVFYPLIPYAPKAISQAMLRTLSLLIAFVFVTALDIIVGELAPKAIGLQFNERVALLAVYPLRLFISIFRPFISLLELGGRRVAHLAGVRDAVGRQIPHSEEELQMLVMASTSAGVLEPEEEKMLLRVFDFANLLARQAMVPRTEIVAVPVDASLRDLLALSARERHTRLPVYEESLDNIIGIVYLRDILHRREQLETTDFDIRRIMREPLLVPETMRSGDLLRIMRQRRVHIAIVIDEFGGTAGLVTLEDLMERIIGEVQDEFEAPETNIEVFDDGSALIDGLTLLGDVNERFELHLDTEEYDTIGGYVFGTLARRPAVGDEIHVDGRTLRVAALDGLRIARVHLIPAQTPATEVKSEP